jgi:hypothetical protein
MEPDSVVTSCKVVQVRYISNRVKVRVCEPRTLIFLTVQKHRQNISLYESTRTGNLYIAKINSSGFFHYIGKEPGTSNGRMLMFQSFVLHSRLNDLFLLMTVNTFWLPCLLWKINFLTNEISDWLYTYLNIQPTPQSNVLLQKLLVCHLVETFAAF